MRIKERQRQAQHLVGLCQAALGDFASWRDKIAAWAGKGYPTNSGSSSIGRCRGVYDPVYAATETDDDMTDKLREIDTAFKDLERVLIKLAGLRAWAVNQARAPEETLLWCVTCTEIISGVGDDRPRNGECPRCAKWRIRKGLPYPKRHVLTGQLGPDKELT